MKGQVTEMKRNIKNFLLFMITTSMTVTGSVIVHASEPEEATGTGKLEGTIPTDIFQIVLPTSADDVFDFILDPQGLINETDGAAYGGKKFEEDATLFFKRTDDEAGYDYSSTSDAVTIINKSSVPVNVTLTAKVSLESANGITTTDDEAFADDSSASLYLAVTDGENTVPIQGEEDTSIQVTIPAADGAYEYRYDSEKDQYIYGLKEDLSGIEFPEYSFRLTGASNGNGNWKEVGDAKPEVIVTWVVTPAEREEEEPELQSQTQQEEEGVSFRDSEEQETPETVSNDMIESNDSSVGNEGSEDTSEVTKDVPEEVPSDAAREEIPLTEPKEELAGVDTDVSPKEQVLSGESVPEKEVSSEGEEKEPEAEAPDSSLLEE